MEMPTFVQITSDMRWLIFLLLAFYGFFCYLLVFSLPGSRSRLNEIGWKKVDYIWLAAAVVGLAIQAGQIRTAWYTSVYNGEKMNLSFAEQNVRRYATELTGRGICFDLKTVDGLPDPGVGSALELQQACKDFIIFKFRDLQSVPLIMDRKAVAAIARIDEIEKNYQSPVIRQKLERLKNAFNSYDNQLSDIGKSFHDTDSTDLEKILGALSPILLVIALALRFAKVTGEVRLKTHKLPDQIAESTSRLNTLVGARLAREEAGTSDTFLRDKYRLRGQASLQTCIDLASVQPAQGLINHCPGMINQILRGKRQIPIFTLMAITAFISSYRSALQYMGGVGQGFFEGGKGSAIGHTVNPI